MKLKIVDRRISFTKELNELDRLAFDFSAALRRRGVRHVFVAGWVSILFGRSRVSEDVDVLMEEMTRDRFLALWGGLVANFECHNSPTPEDAHDRYLSAGLPIRFTRPGDVLPQIELKFARTAAHRWALDDALEVRIGRKRVPISPIELQVAYKLHLGSDKDLGDARYLFRLFREHIKERELLRALKRMNVPVTLAREVLDWR